MMVRENLMAFPSLVDERIGIIGADGFSRRVSREGRDGTLEDIANIIFSAPTIPNANLIPAVSPTFFSITL
jgi:hypothetical protein